MILSYALAAAVLAATPIEPLLATREATLANGLRVVVHAMPEADRVSVRVRFPAGAATDPPGRAGLAHLTEHVAYEGSLHAPDNAYDRWLADAGGTNEGWTSLDFLEFANTVPAGALSLSLFLESDRMGWLAPTQEAMANQRAVVSRERVEAGREQLLREVLVRALWPEGHAYRRTSLGDDAALADVTVEELRAFATDALRPEGAVLVVVGPQPAEELLAEARRWFEEVPRGARVSAGGTDVSGAGVPVPSRPVTRAAWARGDRARSDAARVWVDGDVYPARLRLVWRTVPSGHADAPVLQLVAGLLWDALLGHEVESSHWAGRLGGTFQISVDATNPRRMLRRVERALTALAWRGPTERALTALRARWHTGELRDLESPDGRADVLAECAATWGTPDCLPRVWAAREAVTPDQVRAAVRRWLRPADRVLVGMAPKGAPLPRMYRVDKP